MTSSRFVSKDAHIRGIIPVNVVVAQTNLAHRTVNKYSSRTATMLTLVLLLVGGFVGTKAQDFTNEWAVELVGGEESANELAAKYGFENKGRLFESMDIFMLTHHSLKKRSLSESAEHHQNIISHEKVIWAQQQRAKRRVKRGMPFDDRRGLSDPLWEKTWYLLPTTTPNMKVTEAWKEGYTGKGVVVTILDDGIEYKHPDLAANYDKLASRDINNKDDDPAPRPTYNNENRHGTRCAGEVAAVAGNKYCSAGIAFNASIGGVRMLDGAVTDLVEASSISLNPGHIDIYSASWGPDDDGKTVDGPDKLAKIAFQEGVKNGRQGKGSIFVWASGNGGRKDDNCNCDGYTNSIYTLSISSTTQRTEKPWYSESCSSTLAATYSSGKAGEAQIITTDLSGKCTDRHTGTSASAPLAAGICALALEANKNLTWRDMQHLVVRTANPEGLQASDWITNAVGRKVSHAYGYGLMDAHAMVLQAKNWIHVPQQRICSIRMLLSTDTPVRFDDNSPAIISREITKCDDGSPFPDRLEHVQATLTISSGRRGDVEIDLTSPSGTTSHLLDRRAMDYTNKQYKEWPFMTTHSWDEDAAGTWKLEVRNDGTGSTIGYVNSYTLVLYGTIDADWPKTPSPLHSSTVPTAVKSTTKNVENIQGEVRTKTDKPTGTIPDKTPIGNCESVAESGSVCLVCEAGYVRSPDQLRCLVECPRGYYAGFEEEQRRGRAGIDTKSDRNLEKTQTDGARICTLCDTGPLCVKCDGPGPFDCTQCTYGFQLDAGMCTVVSKPSETSRIYVLTVVVCILSVILFVLLFVFLHYCRNTPHCISQPLYDFVPNQHDDFHSDDPDTEMGTYRKNGSRFKTSHNGKESRVTYTNGSTANGRPTTQDMGKPLLDSDDDGRDFIVDGSRS